MEQTAKVLHTEGQRAVVSAQRVSACEGCHKQAEGSCSACTLLSRQKPFTAEADNTIGAKPGDTVRIETPDGVALGFAALIFLLPILAAFAGYELLLFLGQTEGAAYAGGAVGFALALGAAALYSRLRKKPAVRITRILSHGEEQPKK